MIITSNLFFGGLFDSLPCGFSVVSTISLFRFLEASAGYDWKQKVVELLHDAAEDFSWNQFEDFSEGL